MAIGTMASYTGEICMNRHEAPSWGIITRLVNGTSETYPGHVVTPTGHTDPDVGRPDADTDVTGGIAITVSGMHTDGATKFEIDTYYPDNAIIEIARTGTRLICWVYVDDDEGALVFNTPVYGTGADDDGFVEKMPAIDVDTAFSEAGLQAQFDIHSNAWLRYVGRLYQNIADQGATDTPEKVILI